MEIIGVKYESTDCPTLEEPRYLHIGIDHEKECNNAVTVKKEEYEDAPEPITAIICNTNDCKNSILTTIGGDGKYMCQICSRHFSTRKLILQHMELHIEENNQKDMTTSHKSDICTKLFATTRILQEARNYKCEICDKCFLRKRGLLQHIVRHTGERNHKCEVCGKCFTTKQVLFRHVKTHTGEKSHKCEICSKCFTTKQHLGDHVNRHTGERTYECEICNKCFSTKQYLSQHLKRHIGEKNYECDICNKCSTTKQDLARHVARHRGETDFKCEICHQVYRKRKWLLRHKKTHNEDGGKVRSLQYFPRVMSRSTREEISKINKPLEVETGSFLRNNLENSYDAAERKPSMAINETPSDTAFKEDEESTKIFNLWQTLHNEITIKEEHVMEGS